MLTNFRYYGTDCYTPEIIVCHSFMVGGGGVGGVRPDERALKQGTR